MAIFGRKRGKVQTALKRAKGKLDKVPPASPNPVTNLIIADIALRVGGQLLRHAVERGVLRTKYDAKKAKGIIKGRSMGQTLIGTAVARMATRSVPGAIVVGGGLLAKSLYDRARGDKVAHAEGAAKVTEQADKGTAKE
ncbi:hypothetical protein [Novosphingobium lentum]|uniref:hypothetical protein n=1 Tax=Novosphingobium lentum TaxID=145287 RepID=UPI0008311735|nr:hypothetical protein [Novosphingobium lentum]